jgi:hypothetical protein
MDPNVDDARLLKRNRLYQAAYPFVRDLGTGDTAGRARRFSEFVAWAKSNDYHDMDGDELEWAFNRAEFDAMW